MSRDAGLTAWQIHALLRRANAGDAYAVDGLRSEYGGMVVGISRDYYLAGADREDAEQEAWIGFWHAVRDFRPARGVPFGSFAALCVRRQVITAVKTATRLKHRTLSESARVAVTPEGEVVSIGDLLPSPYGIDPCDILIRREQIERILAGFANLSDMERLALLDVIHGVPYSVTRLGVAGHKRKDNAIQRARGKLAAAELLAA